MAESQSDRDILIEVRTDMKHAVSTLERLITSDLKQWEELKNLSTKAEGHEKSISFLLKGFWGNVSAVVGGTVGLLTWLIRRGN